MKLLAVFAILIWSCDAAPVEISEYTPCPSLPAIPNGMKVFVKDATWEDENICRVHFTCNAGYHLVGSSNIYCFYGQWSGTIPECLSKPCDTLQAPDNGEIAFVGPVDPYLTHSIAEVTCAEGFLIEDNKDNVLICKESGEWSAEPPRCIEHHACNSTGEEIIVIPNNNSSGSPGSYCSSDPCLNGGTCSEFSNTYVCTCPQHYNGHNCEHSTGNTCTVDTSAHCSLGLTDGRVKDSEITASNSHMAPQYARLNEMAYCWMSSATTPWIQVAFASPVVVSGILTRGHYDGTYWITTFKIQYADEDGNLKYIEDKNGVKIFVGNSDHDSVRTNYFDSTITTTLIRLTSVTHQSSYSALRMELLTPTDLNSEAGKNLPSGAVCRFKKVEESDDLDQCEDFHGECGVGMADGRVADSQITAINYYNTAYYPYYARLNRDDDGWRAKTSTNNAWIQVTLDKATDISGIMTRGGGHYSRWVTSFKIQYGNSTNTLTTIQDEYNDKLFPGNWDWNSIRTTYFDSIITAKYLRLVVIYGNTDVYDDPAMLRMELLTPTNLLSEEASQLPTGTVCEYESHRFVSQTDHVLMMV